MFRLDSVLTGDGPVVVVAEGVAAASGRGVRRLNASVERLEASSTTPFRLGSLSKAVTAAALLRLAAERRVDLDGRLADHLDVRGLRWDLRVRHLLYHSIGVGFDAGGRDVVGPVKAYGLRGLRRRPAATAVTLSQGFEPGTAWRYGHVSASLMERVIADCVGAAFPAWMNGEFLARCGMPSSAYGKPPAGSRPMPGTALAFGRVVRLPDVPPASEGACGLWASLDDLLTYAGALAAGGGRGFPETVCRAQVLPGLPERPECPFVTAGLRVSYRAGHTFVLHGGNWWGYSAGLLVDRCCQTAAACLTSGPSVGAAAGRCWRALLPQGDDGAAVTNPRPGTWTFRGRPPYGSLRLAFEADGERPVKARWSWGAAAPHTGMLRHHRLNADGHFSADSSKGRLEIMLPRRHGDAAPWASLSRLRFPAIVELEPILGDRHALAALSNVDR